jgi:site-specific recombinase XerD
MRWESRSKKSSGGSLPRLKRETDKPQPATAGKAAFSLIYRVGVENEKVEKNPAAGIRRKTENNSRMRFMSIQEEKALRKVILKRFPVFVHQLDLSLHTGMRSGKQFALKWDRLASSKDRNASEDEERNTRHIPLNSVALGALQALKVKGEDGHVFPSAQNQDMGLQGSRGWFVSALEDAKIRGYTWHCNRHTFASRLVMAGVDIRTLGELLGHKSLSMTMRYSHLAPAHNAAAVDRLVAG